MKRRPKGPGNVQRVQDFFREYTDGLNTRDVRRLFDRDASRAYKVLTREHSQVPEPKDGVNRFFFRAKLAFLGLSSKLSPPRRLLFGLSLVAFVLGMLTDSGVVYNGAKLRVSIAFSPFWFGVSVGCLIFLLALEMVDRVRVRDELEVARELQADLLPHDLPPLPGYLFAHSYRTANEVGGDYYDLTRLPDGRMSLIVGDASGHGMAAGLVMAIANATLKTALDLDPSPERVLALLNRTLCRTGTNRTFMSVFYAVLTPETGELEYVCAGHPFPFLRRADGSIEELGCGGFPLGMREPLEFVRQKVFLSPGDLLVLYTDGLAEAVDAQGRAAFGYERIQSAVELGGSPQTVHDGILQSFDRHVGGEPLLDDLTLVVVARLPPLPVPSPPRPSSPDPSLP
ncbi:MAG TPA: PP2C family protein-serine/threonine phosphatase [Thermoanaerobaculia bacterium]|nr:PP2C family protein-serine/threonine phosphatase [Thermoanaerobaculia bacterium]